MQPALAPIDWVIVGAYGVFAITLGSLFFKRATQSVESFFVGSRSLPWWLAGTSIVATTFAADTPLAVTGIVAAGGISGNWIWWSWAVAHVVATFFFARLWRRANVITDAEITELRYGGKPAAFLRGFKAVYFGLFINCLTMAWVISAMVKISRAFFDFPPAAVIAACVIVSVLYTTLGGFRSVVVTDLVQFSLGMLGAIVLAVLAIHFYGGLGTVAAATSTAADGNGLLGTLAHVVGPDELETLTAFVPGWDHPTVPFVYFAVLLVAGWWRLAEGNGYIVQRLAASRDETQAQKASLWFAIAHNAVRPWPWILVALASLTIYPRLDWNTPDAKAPHILTESGLGVSPASVDVATGGALEIKGVADGTQVSLAGQDAVVKDGQVKFEPFAHTGIYDLEVATSDGTRVVSGVHVELTDREMGYPLLMRRFLPTGLLGLVIASLLAAFMSTIDTHTNWGASYLVRDLYQRFVRPDASETHAVWVSRGAVVLMGAIAGVTALFIQNIATVWVFLITLGAGLGSVSAARWYWSRVTPHAELAAIGVTTLAAMSLLLFGTPTIFGTHNALMIFEVPTWVQILIIAGLSLVTWVPVAIWGPDNDEAVLQRFASQVRPGGPGWKGYGPAGDALGVSAVKTVAGIAVVYASLFGMGDLLLGPRLRGAVVLIVAAVLLVLLVRWRPVRLPSA